MKIFPSLKYDVPASIVVFFVALPLCLGIALASDAPPLSGIIAGVIGGIIVGALSGSNIGVSGPAAGLTAIVAAAISTLGSFEAFLTAVVLAGIFQLLFGVLRLGIIGYFFPNSVIVGMLSGIGILIMMKQIPVLFGIQSDTIPTASFFSAAFWEDWYGKKSMPSIYLGLIGIGVMIFWDGVLQKKHKFFELIQGPIVAVLLGTTVKLLWDGTALALSGAFLVKLPELSANTTLGSYLTYPDFSVITQQEVWVIAFTLALIASLETLLSVEATDKLDPEKNSTPTNRELFAQGTGNILSGLVGGLPITQVIVRSSANVQSNGKTKAATILHGILLLLAVLAIPHLLNHVPNAVLAAVLLLIGFKLAKPKLFVVMWKRGWTQFTPFIITIVVLLTTDLLKGILAGITVGIIVVLIKSYQNSLSVISHSNPEGNFFEVRFAEEITFLNKAAVERTLNQLPAESSVVLNFRKISFIDFDVVEILHNFATQARLKQVNVTVLLDEDEHQNPLDYYALFENKSKRRTPHQKG